MSALVIGVNYRTDEHAMTFARSLARYPPEDVSVILVDNSERDDPDGFSRQILEANPQIRCIEAPRNLGYFGGADHGLKQYLASSELPDWVIVCNVDIEFRDPQFFTALRELESVESLGVVAPCIWSARWKRDLNPKIAQRPTKGRMLFYKFILGNYYLQTIYELLSVFKNGLKASLRLVLARFRGSQGERKQRDTMPPIYAPHGSCIIFSQRYFRNAGSLEYSMFLFGEEIFVAESARKLGLSVMYCSQLTVLDKENAYTGVIRTSKVARHLKDATDHVVQNYF